jgi:hypothetical protein
LRSTTSASDGIFPTMARTGKNKYSRSAKAGEGADCKVRWPWRACEGWLRKERIVCIILMMLQAEELAKTLGQMKFVLQGTQGNHNLVEKPHYWSRTLLRLIHQKSKLIHNKSTTSLPGLLRRIFSTFSQ